MENSGISWTDHTFNPWIGCTKVGPACDGCYAEALMSTTGRMKRVTWGKPGQRATHARTAPSNWAQPKKWDRAAQAAGKPTYVFCASLADVFDKDAPTEWRRDLFDLIHATPHLTWLLLTKRPQMITRLFNEQELSKVGTGADMRAWPSNAAIGCTVVTQAEADRDVPRLLDAKGKLEPAFAFVSMEPLLGPVDLTRIAMPEIKYETGIHYQDVLRAGSWSPSMFFRPSQPGEAQTFFTNHSDSEKLDWVIAGGETDQGRHKARPSHPDWFRVLRDQCAAAGVPFHFKQWGEWAEAFPDRLTTDGKPVEIDSDSTEAQAIFDQRHDLLIAHDGLVVEDLDLIPSDVLCRLVTKVGKKAAGRAIDGVIHDAMPALGGAAT